MFIIKYLTLKKYLNFNCISLLQLVHLKMVSSHPVGNVLTVFCVVVVFISTCMAVADDEPIDQLIDLPADQPADVGQPIGSAFYRIEDSKRADECTTDITRLGERCRCDHPCGRHGYVNAWCYTDEKSSRYCCTGYCQRSINLWGPKGYFCPAGKVLMVGCDPYKVNPWLKAQR